MDVGANVKLSWVGDSTVAGCSPPTLVPETNTSAGAVKPLPVSVTVVLTPARARIRDNRGDGGPWGSHLVAGDAYPVVPVSIRSLLSKTGWEKRKDDGVEMCSRIWPVAALRM